MDRYGIYSWLIIGSIHVYGCSFESSTNILQLFIGNHTVMAHILTTLGSLSSFARPATANSSSSSSTSHGSHHQHSQACQHSAKSSGVPEPDVTSGKVASMER